MNAMNLIPTLSYRERLAVLLRATADRDEAEVHKKQWDTIGRSRKESAGRRGLSLIAQSNLRPATAKDAARMKELGLPPAWTDVMISDDPNSPYIATGLDSKGRRQPRLNPAQAGKNADAKFARVREFTKELPELRKQIIRDLRSKDPATRETAAVLYLIDRTGFRIGGDTDTKADEEAFGASTLRTEHVKVSGSTVKFSFTAKSGVKFEKEVTDERLAKMIGKRDKGKGELFDTSDDRVRRYLKRTAGDFKVKDFRTYHGTAAAIAQIKSMSRPTNDREFKKAQREVAKVVAAHLGNTPAVALKHYIDPTAWTKWKRR